jgi:uncharacterized protein (TIGR02118 family)
MEKLILLFRKNPELSASEFLSYWRDIHVPLVCEVPHIERYVISPITRSVGGGDPAFHGMAELYFRTHEELDEALKSDATRATARDAKYLAEDNSILRMISNEEEILPRDS